VGKFPVVPAGLVLVDDTQHSWAKFSRPHSTSSGQALRDSTQEEIEVAALVGLQYGILK
jgi:hypothetical protein